MQTAIKSYSASLSTGIYGSYVYPNMDALFVWRDRNIHSTFNRDTFGSIEKHIHVATSTSQAIATINKFKNYRIIYVITNGDDNGEQFIQSIRNDIQLNTEIILFGSDVSSDTKWSAKYDNVNVVNGQSNLRLWVQKIISMHQQTRFYKASLSTGIYGSYLYSNICQETNMSTNPYLDVSMTSSFLSEDDDKNYVAEHSKSVHGLTDFDDEKYGVKQQHFKITSDVDLRLDYRMKSKILPDESGFNIVPMNIYDSPKPVISFALDLSYDNWNAEMEDDFLRKLAKELIVNKHELVILCKSRGSINFSVLVNAVKTQYHNIRVTCAYIQDKAKAFANSSTLKKFCIKSTQIKEWFTKQLKDNTEIIKSAVGCITKSVSSLNKGEQWILNQSTVLKSKLNQALKKLNGQYIVSAICILDNDEALQKFIKHPNLHQSRLLFHGTHLDALGSIYKTGLKHGGGSVYGHGSYLTSSPSHSINYMICYKSGKSKIGEYTLIAAYVNCGNIKRIYDTSYAGKTIENKYDSHYIASVGSAANQKYLGYPKSYMKKVYNEDYRGDTANEYAIKDPTRILPRFYITLKKVKKDCFAYFTGALVSDESKAGHSIAYVVDQWSECVGEGSYSRNDEAFPNAVKSTFDGIAIDEGTRVIIWEKKNFQGKIWLDQTGPALINNVIWKSNKNYNGSMTKKFNDPDLQKLYPQNRRFWSVSNMHDWSKGSVKVMRV